MITRFNAGLTVLKMDRSNLDAADRIAELAEAEAVDLIMMPARDAGIIRWPFGRSAFSRVLSKCRCPLWTAWGSRALQKNRFQRIACALDLAPDSGRILSVAQSLAEQWDCELSIIHAMPEMDESLLQLAALNDLPLTLSPEAVRREVAILQWLAGTSAELQIEISSGVFKAVGRALRRSRADLLVIGPGRNSARSGVLGPNVEGLVRAAPCPVLVLGKSIPARRPEEDSLTHALTRPAPSTKSRSLASSRTAPNEAA